MNQSHEASLLLPLASVELGHIVSIDIAARPGPQIEHARAVQRLRRDQAAPLTAYVHLGVNFRQVRLQVIGHRVGGEADAGFQITCALQRFAVIVLDVSVAHGGLRVGYASPNDPKRCAQHKGARDPIIGPRAPVFLASNT